MNYLLNRRKAFRGAVTDYKAMYLFEDNGNDVTGNHNASMSNVTYSDTGGVTGLGKYSIYNGTTSYGQVTDHADITDPKTVCGWIYISGWGEDSFGRIVDKTDTNLYVSDYASGAFAGKTETFFFQKVFSTTTGTWGSTINRSLSTWYHIAYTYAMDNNVATDPVLYIDGAATVVNEIVTPVGTMTSDTGDDLYIGNQSATSSTFDGRIDNLRIYDRVLSPAEILAIYNHENP
jgi:hypothetical protein